MGRKISDFLRKYGKPPQSGRFGRERRYRCLECRDTGWVTILHPAVIRIFQQEKAPSPDEYGFPKWKTCSVLCTCDAADVHPQEFERDSGRRGHTVPRFGDEPWHINAHDDDAAVQAANFDPVKSSPNYVEEFEAFS